MRRISIAVCLAIALVSVLLLGILQGVLLAAIASIFLLLARASQPNIAFLGRLPGTGRYSDSARHEGVERLVGVIAFRPEASLLYINAETILETVLKALQKSSGIKLVACDLSASPYIDLAGARMLHDLHDELASRHATFCIVGAHAQLRDLLRAEGLAEKTDSGEWLRTLDSVLAEAPEPRHFATHAYAAAKGGIYGNVHVGTALLLSLPAVVGVVLGRRHR
jgi:MFS superfamily sulfate permease-like transporter